MSFPKDFVWGAAAAAYQIEGAACEDGKGASIWDMFTKLEGAIWNAHTGDVACDHYHSYVEDVALMKKIGLNAYRMSISWPRVLPDGTGSINPKGLDFYDRLIDTLIEAGIQPYVTLFHWDYPYELFCRGGWLNRDSSNWFADYTKVVVERLSDRVKHWMTFNEPQVFIGLGHQDGIHAPGMRYQFHDVLRAAHNVLLSHGKSVQSIRAASKSSCQVGFAPVGNTAIPITTDPLDIEAARKTMLSVTKKDVWSNTWWMDPALSGKYPEDGVALFASDMPDIPHGDMDIIKQPLDFLGVNIYNGKKVRAGKNGRPELVPPEPNQPLTAFRWPITPEALRWGPRILHERYGLPIVITENGLSNIDWPALDGKVHDPQRIDFTRRYLKELEKAIEDGTVVQGYFHWSIMDNFEWAEGYRERFGLLYVDYSTQKRTLKDSAIWYKNIIASNGSAL